MDAALVERPVDDQPCCTSDQAPARGGRLQSAACLAGAGGGVEFREGDTTHEGAVEPDTVQSAAGFKDEAIIHGALLDITVEVVRRNPADQGKGFFPQLKRWVVEQVDGTLTLHRRLAREYDHRPDTSTSRVYGASTANMARRLTTPAPTWHDTLGPAA